MNKQFRGIFCFLLLISLLIGLFGCQSVSVKEYSVKESEFYNVEAKRTTSTSLNVKTGSTTIGYNISCTAFCQRTLFEYSATVYVNSKSGALLEVLKSEQKQSIPAGTEFSFQFLIDKNLYDNASSFDVVITGKSYQKTGLDNKKAQYRAITQPIPTYQVSFVCDNRIIKTETITKGNTVPIPQDPQRTNYLFVGWYQDIQFKTKYDFSKPLTYDLKLYAKFELDALTLTNQISQDTIKGIFKIHNKSYNTFLGIETDSHTLQGSGFCFYAKNNTCYILTNCHVAKMDRSYDKQEITVEDYTGKIYRAYLHSISADYDLACLYFEANSSKIKAIKIANQNSAIDDPIISVGAPNGQSNTITYGTIKRYISVSLNDTPSTSSNVRFPVMEHTAYTNSGSSGGAILNADLVVVGVHYAGASSAQLGYAIPAEKIQEFLDMFVWK